MRENKIVGKLPLNIVSIPAEKYLSCTRFDLSLYSAQISKNTKIHSIPIIHEGQNGKMQKWVNRKSKGAKNHKCRKQFS